MIRENNEGLKFLGLTDGSESLIIETEKLDKCIDYVLKGHINKITINSYQGYLSPNIDFVIQLSGVLEGLHVPDDKFNMEVINSLNKLKELGFADNGRDIIDLRNFPNLERLASEYSPRLKGLEYSMNLQNLTLTNYISKSKNLNDLLIGDFSSLIALHIYKTNITSLEGIEKFKSLRTLEFYSASKLTSIKAITEIDLEEMFVEKCKNISDYENLGKVKTLKKIRISESGEIKTLSFLKSLTNLESLSFWGTNVLDGNLDYCEGIPYVGFDDKRHYNHKGKFFDESNELYRLKNKAK